MSADESADLALRKFRRRPDPRVMEAVRLTQDNAKSVAAWIRSAGERVEHTPDGLAIGTPAEHKRAYMGEWLIRDPLADYGFAVHAASALRALYEDAEPHRGEPEPDALNSDDLPWPSWLEGLSAPERVRAIVAALDACAQGHGPPARPHGACGQHCTRAMAEKFLMQIVSERHSECERLQSGAATLGMVLTGMARSMEAARIEMLQDGPEAAMEWILNALPEVSDAGPADQWDGRESAREWMHRTAAGEATTP